MKLLGTTYLEKNQIRCSARLSLYLMFLLLLYSSQISCQTYPKEESRGVWISTVFNIDFPKNPTTNSEYLKAQWLNLLSELKNININTIIVQIRPSGDALYASKYAPWSRWLTGQEGLAPDYNVDILEFMIAAAHEKNMEFHAWMNPYRVTTSLDTSALNKNHVLYTHPEWLTIYGGRYYLNPAVGEVTQYINNIVYEVVEKYDIDAIHFDDYFYPYEVDGEEFNDDEEFVSVSSNYFSKQEFRRNQITNMVRSVNQTIKKKKSFVKFGISPFGVWRNQSKDPRGSQTKAGVTAYDQLYADILKWLRTSYIDYVIPQLYWNIGFQAADYIELTDWWSSWAFDKNVYIGHAAYKVNGIDSGAWSNPNEIKNQIEYNRKYKSIKGSFFFSSSKLLKNPLGLLDTLRCIYRYPSKHPNNFQLNSLSFYSPEIIEIKNDGGRNRIQWTDASIRNEFPYYYIIYRFSEDEKHDFNSAKNIIHITGFGKGETHYFDSNISPKHKYAYYITSVNRTHFESKPMAPFVVLVKKNKTKLLSKN